ncbi:globin [Nocardioides sp. Kera G14]|uniref:globin n=1 Tax=Nocardioides sp. Kera G14 TaxID=2884264 RepID=UPI001D102619|nr:globin [Nocardioides sp. Kera G14]UDY24468.1 globin [Nocardioides sp. Kera G14]
MDTVGTGGQTFFDQIGGLPTIQRVVAKFYEGVVDDPILGPMYPVDDMAGAQERLTHFLAQYWGGPSTYSEQRGHPRLRMRHAPYAVTREARDHWLALFRAGLDEVDLTPEQDAEFWSYVTRAADFMINADS